MHYKTRRLTESALMIALAAVLAMVKVLDLPQGGSITAASMVPIIFVALRYGTRWGVFSALVFSVIQMIQGFYPPPTQTLFWFVLVVLLDYVVAFGVLGLAPLFAKRFRNRVTGACVATVIVCLLRFCCHFLSGLIIWGTGDPAVPDWLWSLPADEVCQIGCIGPGDRGLYANILYRAQKIQPGLPAGSFFVAIS